MTVEPRSPLKNPLKTLLGNGQFLLLFTGNTSLFLAFAATILLRSLLAWELTQDEMSLAYINLVTAICMFVTSIFSGAAIDRFERRKLLILAQWIIFAMESVVLGLLVSGHLTFGILLMSSAAASFTFPFIMPARTAMVVEAVPRPLLGKANAVLAAGVNVARLASPAVVGVLADAVGIVYGYVYLLSLHLLSQLCSFHLAPSSPPEGGGGNSFLREISDGFVYLSRNRPLALCILYGLIPNLIVVPLLNLMVVIVEEIWHRGGTGLGIMMSAMGIGGLLGSFFLAVSKGSAIVRPMVFSTLGLGVFIVAFCHSSSFPLAVILLVGAYSCSVYGQTIAHTGVQLMTDDRLRGRITTMTLMTYGLAPLATFPLAFGTKHIGAASALTISTVSMVVAALLIWRLSTSFRRIDDLAKIR